MKPYYKNDLTTIYNGDCIEVMDYLIEQGVKFDAIITDPPYGTTACSWDTVIPFDEMWSRLKQLRKDKTPIVLFGSEPFNTYLRMSNINEFRYDWIWKKNIPVGFMNANKMPLKSYEVITIFYNKLPNYYPVGVKKIDKKTKRKKDKSTTIYNDMGLKNGEYTKEYTNYPIDIIKVDRELKTIHPTQKPLELMKYLIETYTKKGDLILDFTAGSFTTCVGADQLGRKSIGIELEQKYCDIGIERLNKLQMRLDI